MAIPTLSPNVLRERLEAQEPCEVLDVRTPVEFREIHLARAKNVPLDRLNPADWADRRPEDGPVYVVCRTGSRAQKACEKLSAAGVAQVVNIEGGTLASDEAGLPMVRCRKAISLERQVRIAAGSLVLLGAILAVVVHPYWAALSGFVGAGLIFAGVTDTCGMGLMLARMPWNRVATSTEPASCAIESRRNSDSQAA